MEYLWHHHEIVRTRERPFGKIPQNMMGTAEGQFHHYWKTEPFGPAALQSENTTHNPIPSFEYPFRCFMFPVLRRILWWIKIAQSVRLRFHNLNVIVSLRVKGI